MKKSLWIGMACLMAANLTIADTPPLLAAFDRIAAEAIQNGHPVVQGQGDWLFLARELRHLSVGPFWGEAAQAVSRADRVNARDPLPAILDFHQQLQAIGVRLLLVPVPPKALIHAEDVAAGITVPAERADVHHQAFYQLLREAGVDVLDLTASFHALPAQERGPVYCQRDTHWSGVGCVAAAKRIAKHIRPWLAPLPPSREFTTEWQDIEIYGDLDRLLKKDGTQRERIAVRTVTGEAIDPDSPVLLLGDSHTLVFHAGGDLHTRQAGLPEQLAVELGIPVDLIGVRGSGATPARINLFRRTSREDGFWDRKQVVVWIFAAREFTEADGWRPVPIQR